VAALAAVLVAVQAAVLFGLRAGETRTRFDPAEIAPSLEAYGDRTLAQTFIAQADGLTAITVYPSPRRSPLKGAVELTLEVDSQTPVARATVAAADFLARPEWTWTFPPVAASARRLFRLRVAAPAAAAVRRITPTERSRSVNGRSGAICGSRRDRNTPGSSICCGGARPSSAARGCRSPPARRWSCSRRACPR
jgi:hypothetical protein